MAGETKFLDLTGLSTFLNNIKYNYAQGSAGYIPLKASQLETARTISLTGDITGSVSFDGTQNVSIATTAGAGVANVVENVGWKQSGASSITWLTPATVDSKEKAVYIDLSNYALKSDIAAALNFKGAETGANLTAMTASDVSNGDVYTCTSDDGNFHAGYEYAATISNNTLTWVELGKYLDLSGYVQKTQKVNNKALSGDIVLDGSDVALSSGYAVASTAAAPAAGDSIDTAVGKLQKEVADANAAATTYAFAEGSTNGAFQVTPTVGGVAGSAQSVAIHGLGSAAYTDSTAYVAKALEPAEAGAQVNVIESITVNGGSALTITDKNVDITVPTAAASIADGATGYATGDQVYDYVEAHKGDTNVIETVKVNGSALTPDANKAVDVTVPVQDVRVSTDGSTYTTVLDSSTGNADIDLSGYAELSDLDDFIDLTDLSVTAGTGDYVTGIAYDNTTGVFTETKAAKGSIANNDTGLVDGDTVYDYFEAHKADGNVIESISVNGTTQTITNKNVDITVPTQASAIADSDTGYATGDQVYDYIEAMAIPDATINGLFPANPSSGS